MIHVANTLAGNVIKLSLLSGHVRRIMPSVLLLTIFLLISCSAGKVATKEPALPETHWVGTWATSQQLVEPHNNPPEPGLSNNSLRQIFRISIGGDSLRFHFSNEFSKNPVTLKKVAVALSTGGSSIDESSARILTFAGKTEITMEAGKALVSDPVAMHVNARTDLAITIYFGNTSPDVTGHPGSRTTSYILTGDKLLSADFNNAIPTDHWYVIAGADVMAPAEAGAIAILGNSITDGRGSGTNKQNRWPDVLAERLLKNPATQDVAVLNHGIGGNCVLRPCLGPSAIDRFDSDVIRQRGVRWLIILEGVNDLGQTPSDSVAGMVAEKLIEAYSKMIDKAHQHGIKVYGATILPFGKSFYYADHREAARNKVNEWIRNSGRFDAVIDFDKAMQNPGEPLTLLPDAHTGDYLHPNEKGYVLMAEAVDLKLFE